MEKIGASDIQKILIDMRKKINPDFKYSEKEAERILGEKESELSEVIEDATLGYLQKQGGLKYSGMPNKYKDMKFSDLLRNEDNSRVMKQLILYIKNFKRMPKGVGLVGGMGVGKTTLIAITCKEIVERYEKTLYFASESAILSEIKNSINNKTLDTPEDIVRRISSNDLVVIDELGTTSNQWEMAQIKQIIDGVLNNNNKLFITSNYGPSDLLGRWQDGNTNKTPRQIVDRMNEAMDIYRLQGKSFRR